MGDNIMTTNFNSSVQIVANDAELKETKSENAVKKAWKERKNAENSPKTPKKCGNIL